MIAYSIYGMTEVAALVGDSAALMLFAQQGACIGRRFKLYGRNGKIVEIEMTPLGARIEQKLTKAQLAKLAALQDDTIETDID